jgi:hypothetical protein
MEHRRQRRAPALGIIVGAFSKAMSLSGALKRRVRSFAGDSSFKGFEFHHRISAGVSPSFARWNGQAKALRTSLVAGNIVIAQVCRRTCGDTRCDLREAQC